MERTLPQHPDPCDPDAWEAVLEEATAEAEIAAALPDVPPDPPSVAVPDDAIIDVSDARKRLIAAELRESMRRHCPSAPESEWIAAAGNIAAAFGFYGLGLGSQR